MKHTFDVVPMIARVSEVAHSVYAESLPIPPAVHLNNEVSVQNF